MLIDSKKLFSQVFAFFAIMCLAACSSTQVLDYDGPKVVQGSGGAKETVEGIDLWKMGTPNQKYEIIGVVEDAYFDNGSLLGSALAGSAAQTRVVKAAKERGADGAILLGRSETPFGVSGQVNAYGGFHATQKAKVAQQVALIRYVN